MFMYMIAKMKPQIWDVIGPTGLKVSPASREYMIAIALKGFSSELGNKVDTKKLVSIQHTLVKFASDNLASGYVDDDWCGTLGKVPIPVPVPTPWSSHAEVMLNPQPLPPAELPRDVTMRRSGDPGRTPRGASSAGRIGSNSRCRGVTTSGIL